MKHILKENKVSWFSWLPCIWLVLCSTRIGLEPDLQTYLARELAQSNEAQSNLLMQVSYTLLTCLGLYCLFTRKINWKKIIIDNIWLILFFLYLGFSVIWSDYPIASLKRYFKAIGIIVMILVVYTDDYPQLTLSYVLKKVFMFHVLMSAVLILLVPSQGIMSTSNGETAWVGFTTNKNFLGQITCFASIYFFWAITKRSDKQKKISNIFLFLVSFFILVGAQSMTSLLVLIMAILLFQFYRLKVLSRFTIFIYLFCIILFFLTIATLDQVVFQGGVIQTLFDLAGRDLTLTGRTDLWKDVLSIASHNLFLGVGYDSFWMDGSLNGLWDIYIWQPNQAHNGYIDIIANIGVLGFVLMICTTFSAIINISSQFSENYDLAKLRMVFLTTILISNLTESTLCRGENNVWFFYLLVVFTISNHIARPDSKKV